MQTKTHRIILAGATVALGALCHQAASAATLLDRCSVITAPGEYILTQNATQPAGVSICFNIKTSNVTLDLGGHTVRGISGQPGAGVYAFGSELLFGIKVMNGTVADFTVGVELVNTFGAVVSNVNAVVNSSDGIHVGNGALLQKVTVQNNGETGIIAGAGLAILDSTIQMNQNGLVAGKGSLIRNVYSGFNREMGMLIKEDSDISQVHGSLVEGNGKDGMRIACPAAVSGNPAAKVFPNKGYNFVVTVQDVVKQLTPVFKMDSTACVMQGGGFIDSSSTTVDQVVQ